MKPASPEELEALAWMREQGRGYRAAARHFGLKRKHLEEVGRARPSRAPAPARPGGGARPPARASESDTDELLGTDEATPAEVDDNGVPWDEDPIEFIREQIDQLDKATSRNARELAGVIKIKTELFERLQAAKRLRAGTEELKEVEAMIDRMLLGLQDALALMTAKQRKRLRKMATTSKRLGA